MTKRSHINERLKTNFYPQGNRAAGTGITEDRYDEESFPDPNPFDRRSNSFWHKPVKVEGGPVKTYKLSEEELRKYREMEAGDEPDKETYQRNNLKGIPDPADD